MTKKIFIITGEYSGDNHASKVVRELKKLYNNDVIIEGVGESNLQNEGVKLLYDHKKMGKMGLTFSSIVDHITMGKNILKYLKEVFKPDLVLLVDYGAFNLQISKHLKKAGYKVYYFIPPQIWASRKYRIKTVKKYIDKVFAIFPFERELYENEGIKVEYTGHPIVNELPEYSERDAFFEKHNLDKNKKLISVFPGSRMFEIKYLLNIFKKAADILTKFRSDIQIVFCHADSLKDNAFSVPYKTIKGENHQLLAYSDFLILASGTVALEACMYETPMLIAYKGPLFFYLIYLLVRNIKKACLVNIISNKDYVKEFLMYDANPKKIADYTQYVLDNDKEKEHIISGCKEVKQLLNKGACAFHVASVIKNDLDEENI